MTTTFPIPTSAQSSSGKTPSTTGGESEKTNYTLEDCLIDLNLLPKKRNDARHKAMRLLIAGRLRVVRVEGDVIVAECRGDSGQVYHLGHDPNKAPHWRCTCQAKTACSHLHALWAVTALA